MSEVLEEKVTYEVIDRAGLQKFAEEIFTNVNKRIAERIVTDVSSDSDDLHVASAAAVYKTIAATKHARLQPVTGDLDTVVPEEERDSNVIYLQRDDTSDNTWAMYIWATYDVPDTDSEEDGATKEVTEWVSLGTTEINLDNYWSKDEVSELKTALGIDTLETEVSNKVDKDQMVKLSEDDISGIISSAYTNTEVLTAAGGEEETTQPSDNSEQTDQD